jgi:putative flippase GtrA
MDGAEDGRKGAFGYRIWFSLESLIRRVSSSLFKCMRIELTEKQNETYMQFVGFCVVGVLNTIVGWAVYYAFVIFDPALYLVGNVAGYICGVMNSYYWNSRFVFAKERSKSSYALFKTYISYGVTLVLSTVLMFILVDKLSVSEFIAPIPTLLMTVPLNFILNKFWTFGSKKLSKGSDIV